MQFEKSLLFVSVFVFIFLFFSREAMAFKNSDNLDENLAKIESMLAGIKSLEKSDKFSDDPLKRDFIKNLKLELFTISVIQAESLNDYLKAIKYGNALQTSRQMLEEIIGRLDKYEVPMKTNSKNFDLENCKIIKYSDESDLDNVDMTMLGINQVQQYLKMISKALKDFEIEEEQKKNLLVELNQELRDTSAFIEVTGKSIEKFIENYRKISRMKSSISVAIGEISLNR